MAGGLLQLVAYGAQDMYLTNDPQITFFKVVYRRGTAFSIQPFEKTFNDNPTFGQKASVKLYRLGDLASKMYLRVVINRVPGIPGVKFAWIRRLGHALIKHVEIKIGGSVIDKHYGTWLDIWYELARKGQHDRGYSEMIGDVDYMTDYNDKSKPEFTLYIPLQFWFNRHYGLALPLIAIQYHEIYINLEFEEREKLIVRCDDFTDFSEVRMLDVGLVTDYIYLDLEERIRFAMIGHEYLIEQAQYYGEEPLEVSTKRLLLDFNHPTKEIIWAMRNGNYTQGNEFLCYSNKEDWTPEILKCSKRVLQQSSILLKGPTYTIDSSGNKILETPGDPPPNYGIWEEFEPGVENQLSSNGSLLVTNMSETQSLWVNVGSLLIGDYSITDKIIAEIIVDISNIITFTVASGMLSRDISFPKSMITDTRINPDPYICVYQFSNYGLFITGEFNPLAYAELEYNGQNRVEKRNSKFFGELQPYIHHSNTPADGINLYSFAVEPEKHQPTGTSNFSKIENIILSLWFEDCSNKKGKLPDLNFINADNRLYVFAFNYNIYRIISGVTGLAYNG